MTRDPFARLDDRGRLRLMGAYALLALPVSSLLVFLSLVVKAASHPDRPVAALLQDGPGNLLTVLLLNAVFVPVAIAATTFRTALTLAALYLIALAAATAGYALVVRALHAPSFSVGVLVSTASIVGPLCAFVVAGPLRSYSLARGRKAETLPPERTP